MAVSTSTENSSPTEELRAAFARGISAESAAVFLRARDTGLDWERATSAVAAGLADRYAATAPSLLPRSTNKTGLRLLSLVVGCLLAYIILRVVVGFGHELTVAALASLLHLAVGRVPWESAVGSLGLDPIYTGAAIRAAGGVQVAGFAVAGPIGSVLHVAFPGVFLACDQVAGGAGVSMVARPGTPAIGRGLASFGADVVWLAIGLWLFVRWRRRDWRVAVIGLLAQAQIAVNHLLQAQVSLADLDASGLPFAIQVAVPNGGWFTTDLADMPSAARALITGLILLTLGYACAALLLGCATAVARCIRKLRRVRRTEHVGDVPWTGLMQRSTAVAGAIIALLTAWSPVGAFAVANSNWHTVEPTSLTTLSPIRPAGAHTRSLRLAGATPVVIAQQSDGSWQYVVDGVAETIRGVGYNPWYATLTPAERTSLYNRDFSDMRRLGINTIEGWFENQFDSVTLDAAARNGIGVLMPFELNQDWDYTDPAVRAGILDRLGAYVEKYKNHPAVRMWAPGNENLHRILFAHWVSQLNDPIARARAEALAAFLPEVVDRIHALDPNHPVVYRDAQDAYLTWIASAFDRAGGQRPWLVYGANVYTAQRLQDVISKWPTQWPGRPLLISEYAPGGMGPADRPLGFQQLWQMIRSRPGVVLGGLAYTWATNGPEDLDRVFGLVDPNGVPTDGALAALSGVYLSESAVADTPTGQ